MTRFRLGAVNLGLLVSSYLCGLVPVLGEVELPPRVTWGRESQERIIIRSVKGPNYMINCTAEGFPKPTFQWKKDDQVLGDSQEYIKAFSNGTLLFKNFGSREDGLYQCLATNIFGTSLSVKVPLVSEKEPAGDPGGASEPVTLTLEAGQPATLKCAETPATVPEYVKRWYFKDNTEEVELTQRVGTDAEGNLRFAYLVPSDDNTYVCGLAPRVAHEQQVIRMYNNVELRVSSGTNVATEPRPEFSTGNGNTKAYLTRNVTLECYFSGFPLSTITWKNTSNQLITDKRFQLDDFGRKLIISSVLPEDEGSFSCTANNGHGEKTLFIKVNVTSRPFKVANQGLTSLVLPDRRDVTLPCQAKAAYGENLDQPVWYRNGQILRDANLPDPARYSFSPDRTQLYIRNTSKNVDTACFQCNVTNSEGYTFYDGFLKVIDSIVISKQPNKDIEVSTDDAVDITVFAQGDACCPIDYQWLFNDNALTVTDLQTPPFVFDPTTNVLIFNATTVSEEQLAPWYGQYKCRVSNTYEHRIVQFSISKKGEVAPKVAESEFQLWWIAIIVAVLLIIIIILLIFCCIKRNYPGETYQLEKTELKHHLNPKEELLNQSFQEV
ncbi:hypothetical protein BsWGS_14076 [Bradybaena similaris]